MTSLPPESGQAAAPRRRRLRAVFAADVANFGGLVSVDETKTLDGLTLVRRIALETLGNHGGWLFGLPGDGIFALFESAVDAVRCALETQARLTNVAQLDDIRLRIGIHLGEVVFENELPFGEALVIAARLESMAEPGGILVSSAVRDAVAPRIAADFEDQGVHQLKHSPRLVSTFSVAPSQRPAARLVEHPLETEPTPLPAPTPPEAAVPGPVAVTAPPAGPAAVEPARQSVPAAEPAQPEPPALHPSPPAPPAPPPTPPPAPPVLSTPIEAPEPVARPVPVLPKVQPFVVPQRSVLDQTMGRRGGAKLDRTQGRLNRTRAASGPPPDVVACQGDLAVALTTFLGPIARVLVKRFAPGAGSARDLVDKLAAEIRAEGERREFLEAARRILDRFGS